MFLWFYLIYGNIFNESCGNKEGVFVINYNVHANLTAQLRIMEYVNNQSRNFHDQISATKHYFKAIFKAINKSIERNHVKIAGNFTKLNLEDIDDKLKYIDPCKTNNAVGFLSNTLKVILNWPKTPGIGNRILVYSCTDGAPEQISFTAEEIQDCGNLSVVHMVDPKDSIKTIMNIVEGAITYNTNKTISIRSKGYTRNLCRYARTCAAYTTFVDALRFFDFI